MSTMIALPIPSPATVTKLDDGRYFVKGVRISNQRDRWVHTQGVFQDPHQANAYVARLNSNSEFERTRH